jgi:hypothetical protein
MGDILGVNPNDKDGVPYSKKRHCKRSTAIHSRKHNQGEVATYEDCRVGRLRSAGLPSSQ